MNYEIIYKNNCFIDFKKTFNLKKLFLQKLIKLDIN